MAGFIIVLIFAAMAILAPVISPYPRNFEAPTSDRFVVHGYNQTIDVNLDYNAPVLGPTTPLSADKLGGVWEINSNRQGSIYMNFLQYSLVANTSPYRVGNLSVTLDITQAFGVTPIPGTPLQAVYYIVPGKNVTATGVPVTFGPSARNGLIAAFAGNTFVVGDPFTGKAVYDYTLPYAPLWTSEDPAAAGQMLVAPTMRLAQVGIVGVGVGPYRYLYASDGNRSDLFEISYCHSDPIGATPTYCGSPGFPVLAPYGRHVASFNLSLSAPPLVYYNQESVVTQPSNSPFPYREGPGQAFLLPLANGTLAVANVTGNIRAWVPLTLGGQPAVVDGSMGFVRSTYPLFIILPLRSAGASGLAVLDLNSLQLSPRESSFADPSLVPLGQPSPYRAQSLFFAYYNQSLNSTHLFSLFLNATSGNLTPNPQFDWTFAGRVRSYFEVPPDALPTVFIYTEEGKLYTMATVFGATAVVPEEFPLAPPPGVPEVVYAGSFGGTLYGGGLTPQELNGVWLDGGRGQTVVFQLLGTIRTPLPPGTYPSGNTYLLGTDFNGADMVTLLFYGSQVAFIVGLLAALFAVGIGTLVGLLAGYFGKLIDTLLMRTTDVFLVLPFLPVVLVLEQIMRPSIWVIVIILAILGWPGIARVVRSQVLTLKERPFVDAARVSGASDLRLVFLHIAPNVLPFSFLYMSLTVSGAIITEAILSFLGLGDPYVISWGGILSSVLTQGGALTYWWWLVPPGLCITFLSLGFYLLGRGFDEIINPRLRRR
ncbi:MAG TPA: ABC transporter permease [Thermoplasmata archaeon]|nr:ABC transporter permease [Thermoplasmata archaeon]